MPPDPVFCKSQAWPGFPGRFCLHDQNKLLPRREAGVTVIMAICLLSGLSASGFLLAPLFYGALAQSRGYDPALLGTIASVGGFGGLLTALTSPLWMAHVPLRVTALGLAGLVAAALSLLMFVAVSPLEVMLAMGLYGVAMGALYTLMFGAVLLYSRPERTLGWKLGTESVPGLIMLYAVSNILKQPAGFDQIALTMLSAVLVLGLAAFLLPNVKLHNPAPVMGAVKRTSSPGLWLAAGATFILWGGVNGLWTFIGRIGGDLGLSVATIGSALTVAWVFASIGGLSAGAVGARFGAVRPFLLGTGLGIAALAAFLHSTGASFVIAANVFITASVFSAVYAVALITNLITRPVFAGLPSIALQSAVTAGPSVGGYIYRDHGSSALFIFTAGCFLTSILLYLLAYRTSLRPAVIGTESLKAS